MIVSFTVTTRPRFPARCRGFIYWKPQFYGLIDYLS
jgi:hypothetical protein